LAQHWGIPVVEVVRDRNVIQILFIRIIVGNVQKNFLFNMTNTNIPPNLMQAPTSLVKVQDILFLFFLLVLLFIYNILY